MLNMRAFWVAVVLAGSVVGHAESLRETLASRDAALTKAMKAKDFAKIKKLIKSFVSSDFVYVEEGRKQTADQMLAGMKMGLGALKKVTVANAKILTLKETGNTAVATSIHSAGGLVAGRESKPHEMVYIGDVVETYKKIDGKWKLQSMRWNNTKMTMDGKPFNPGTPPKK